MAGYQDHHHDGFSWSGAQERLLDSHPSEVLAGILDFSNYFHFLALLTVDENSIPTYTSRPL
jgi:hypothetical protein